MSYTQAIERGRLQCTLCPHSCLISNGNVGKCRIRANENGKLALPYFGHLSALAIDPIEKKPLFHFFPGRNILSAGFFGCNFRCPFCQNHTISQKAEAGTFVSPEKLVENALESESIGIAYTYSEPLVHFEYVIETAKLARENNLTNVIVSNGYLSPAPTEELLQYIDAGNIDLKSFNPDFYKSEIGGKISPVMDFIAKAAERISLEITTLVIPTKNDSEAEIEHIAKYIASIDNTIPLHLSCYYPTYKYVIEATPPQTVLRLAEIARNFLLFVYPGNVGTHQTNTNCPACSATLIKRIGYSTEVVGITEGNCNQCGHSIGIPGT